MAFLFHALPERSRQVGERIGDPLWRKPITDIAACCAQTTNGHMNTAPPRRVMNSRRLN
jgi:hypothetical protein